MAVNVHHRLTGSLSTLAVGSIVVAVVVWSLKVAAWLLTGSVALFSDAIESVINVVTAIAALVAIRVSARPADHDHQFGHHKAEYLSAGIVGALIVIAAVLIMREAMLSLLDPHPISAPITGMVVNSVATGLNALWSWTLVQSGRRLRSPALVADGLHLFTDVATSVGVVVGLALVAITGLQVLDPLIAIAVALHILWIGWGVAQGSASSLLDEAVAKDVADEIRKVIGENASGALQVHDIRTRVAGAVTFIEFHLVVPSAMTVKASHDICDRIEAGLIQSISGAEVMIHVEPEREAKAQGEIDL
jgi:cation diffusion facilitator family transporter